MVYLIILVAVAALILGLIKYFSLSDQYKDKKWQLKFIEIWNDFFNFFIAGLIGYYFFKVRMPNLLMGLSFNVSDLILFIIFMLGIFGHLCVMSKNITDSIEVIFKKILDR